VPVASEEDKLEWVRLRLSEYKVQNIITGTLTNWVTWGPICRGIDWNVLIGIVAISLLDIVIGIVIEVVVVGHR
jgi:hypothetical protein